MVAQFKLLHFLSRVRCVRQVNFRNLLLPTMHIAHQSINITALSGTCMNLSVVAQINIACLMYYPFRFRQCRHSTEGKFINTCTCFGHTHAHTHTHIHRNARNCADDGKATHRENRYIVCLIQTLAAISFSRYLRRVFQWFLHFPCRRIRFQRLYAHSKRATWNSSGTPCSVNDHFAIKNAMQLCLVELKRDRKTKRIL